MRETREAAAQTVTKAIRTLSARVRPDSGWVVWFVAAFALSIVIAAVSVSFER